MSYGPAEDAADDTEHGLSPRDSLKR